MRKYTIGQLALITGGKVIGDDKINIERIVTDSRTDCCDGLFIAIKGENFDGHQYVGAAFAKGAEAAMVSALPEEIIKDKAYLVVDDTIKALGKIAASYLSDGESAPTRIAITGSVGKTTTKEMVSSVLSKVKKVHASKKNNNNEIGCPLNILSMEADSEILICEMGMRGMGQIEYLSDIARPDIGIITNVGSAHLEILGTRENILRAKLEVCKFFRNGILILNSDNDMTGNIPLVRKILKEYGQENVRIITFGIDSTADVKAEEVTTEAEGSYFTIKAGESRFRTRLNVPGLHNVYNALCCCACCLALGLAPELVQTVEEFGDEASRQRIIKNDRILLLDDTYNAGPESMAGALSVLANMKGYYKIAVLGDMLELGAANEESHIKVGELAKNVADSLYAVGENAKGYIDGYKKGGGRSSLWPDSLVCSQEVTKYIKALCGDPGIKIAILVKGSNAMKMDIVSRAVEEVMKEWN